MVCGGKLVFVIALVELDEADRFVDIVALVVILGDFDAEDLFEASGSINRFGDRSAVDVCADFVDNLGLSVVDGKLNITFEKENE